MELNPLNPGQPEAKQDDQQTAPLNYFNYFTEVEEEFVRRRGKPLLISPMDWALVESWKNAGIPLHVVLRAINQTFDASDARPRQFRRVNSVLYCQQEVEACFAAYKLAQVGGQGSDKENKPEAKGRTAKAPSQSFSADVLLAFIARCDEELVAAAEKAGREGRNQLIETISRIRERLQALIREISDSERVDPEAIERDFDSMDRLIVEAATSELGAETIATIRAEAESQLRPFRRKMDKSMYAQTLENFVTRRVREVTALPRLSLFYL